MLTSQRHRDRHVDAQASEAYICGFLTIWIPIRGARVHAVISYILKAQRGADIVNYLRAKVYYVLYTYLKP